MATGNGRTNGLGNHEVDVVVVGAGFAGLYMLHRLRGLGFSADGDRERRRRRRHVVLEPLSRCALRHREHRLLVQLRPRAWSASGSGRSATRRSRRSSATSNHVADKLRSTARHPLLDARRRRRRGTMLLALASSAPTAATRSAAASTSWRRAASRFRRRRTFRATSASSGQTYYTSRWPHEGVDFTGKRVAVIGTGSSGVQSIPIIAQEAAELIVFQRTPNFSRPAKNGPVPAAKKAAFDGRSAAYREAGAAGRGPAYRPRSA